jgi:hypothetical protein
LRQGTKWIFFLFLNCLLICRFWNILDADPIMLFVLLVECGTPSNIFVVVLSQLGGKGKCFVDQDSFLIVTFWHIRRKGNITSDAVVLCTLHDLAYDLFICNYLFDYVSKEWRPQEAWSDATSPVGKRILFGRDLGRSTTRQSHRGAGSLPLFLSKHHLFTTARFYTS